jgi:hypothetical protein
MRFNMAVSIFPMGSGSRETAMPAQSRAVTPVTALLRAPAERDPIAGHGPISAAR